MKVKSLMTGWFLLSLVFLGASNLHADVQDDLTIEYKFPHEKTLVYSFPKSGTPTISLETSTASSQTSIVAPPQQVLAQGDIKAISINPDTSLARIPSPLRIHGVTIQKAVVDEKWGLAMAQVGDTYYLFDEDGGKYPIPLSPQYILWNGEWSLKSYINDSDKEPYYVIMNRHPGFVVAVVVDPKLNNYAALRIPDSPIHPINIKTFALGFSQEGEITLLGSNGLRLRNGNGSEIRTISPKQMKPLTSKNLDLHTGIHVVPNLGVPESDGSNNTSTALAPISESTTEQDLTEKSTASNSSANNENGSGSNSAKQHLADIKAWLDRTIIGQPEIIQGLYDLEVKNVVFGYRRKLPEVKYMMGLPGTGKDTAAESYVDAIYQQEGAHEKHLYRLPILKRSGDIWSLEGSPTGYKGSDDVMEFIKWLVAHSGGRYKMNEGGSGDDKHSYVTENPNWKPGEILDGYEPPEKGVVFINEFQNYSKSAKDAFLKQALEKGYFDINNPGEGIGRIYVPVTFLIASNEGIDLLSPRKGNGERAGKPLTYEQLLANWKATHNNEELLKREIMRTNGLQSGGQQTEESPGISEELLDRIAGSDIYEMRPLSPQDLQKIIQIKLGKLQGKYQYSMNITWTDDLVRLVQEYRYDAERNARQADNHIDKLIDKTLRDAVVSGQIDIGKNKINVQLDLRQNPDKTMTLIVKMPDKTLELPIAITEADKDVPLKTDEELAPLLNLGDRLKQHVFGNDRVADEVSKDILVSEEGRQSQRDSEKATEPARSYMFLGPSSTGKTEMAKAIAQEYLGSESSMTTFDFSQVRTVEDLKARILGARDGLGNPVASEFMREYDAHQGRIVVVLDELANAPKDALKALYDILREPVVRTFSDGVPRPMSGVVLIMTGNAGEEWYQDIPRNIPVNEQEAAMASIYEQAMKDPDSRRRTLEKYFSEAFINRVGEQNIFFFGPLDFKAVRQLTQLKLLQALKRLKTTEGRRDWNVVFATKDDYIKTMETIETEGFVLREQGASIDRFVKQDIEGNLRQFLLNNKVPNGATVVLRRADEKIDREAVYFDVRVVDKGYNQTGPLYFSVDRRVMPSFPKMNVEDTIITAFHEGGGHEMVRHILMGDKFKSTLITIQPGVTQIDDHWIRYLGLASQEQEQHFQLTREAVIREIAVKAAGGIIQSIVTQGSMTDAGKSNDMERATAIAQLAILKWGLSPAWGNESIPTNLSVQDYINTLSPDKKKLFEQEVDKLIQEGELMAESVILTNMDTAIALSLELAEKGTMDEDALAKFYSDHDTKVDKTGYQAVVESPEKLKALEAQWKSPATDHSMDGKLSPKIPRPKSVANIDNIVATQKAEQVAQVALPDHLPVFDGTLPPLSTPPTPVTRGPDSKDESLSVKGGNMERPLSLNEAACVSALSF